MKWSEMPAAYGLVLMRVSLFAGLVAFITFLLPSQGKIKLDAKPGQTWKKESLYAPFDFAVRKSADELEQERRRALTDFSPYYRFDEDIAEARLAQFEQLVQGQLQSPATLESFPDAGNRSFVYIDYGKRLLRKMFERGIIRAMPEHAEKGKTFVINVISGNTSSQQTLEYFYTESSALDFLIDTLPASGLTEPDFLYPLLEKSIVPNLLYDAELTGNFRQEMLAGVSEYRGVVKKGELIAARNSIVTEDIWLKINSVQELYDKEIAGRFSPSGIGAGYFILALLLCTVYFIYLQNREPSILSNWRKLVFTLFWIALYAWLIHWAEETNPINAYFIPFSIAPIILQTFYNKRLALFTHVIIILTASFITSLGWDFTFLQLLAGIVVLLTNVDVNSWPKFFFSIFSMLVASLLAFTGLTLVEHGNLFSWNWTILTWIFLSAFLTLLALPLVPLLESIFGFVSAFRLRELMDLNRPLLRELAIKAPGTLQHSIQVGNLSEAAAREIGADALLLKCAALYHDVGKMLHPEYFVENQSGIESPHEEKSNLDSARIIISHVTEGEKMARKSGLPPLLIDFITTHHGTTRVEYFYRKMLNESSDEMPDELDFLYPGPKPHTKEQTIFMMADSIEAACRSLKQPTEQSMNELIDNIIAGKIKMGQLEESPMSFNELERCRAAFKRFMRSVHHQRIEYPELKKE